MKAGASRDSAGGTTSRPELLSVVGCMSNHSGSKKILLTTVTITHESWCASRPNAQLPVYSSLHSMASEPAHQAPTGPESHRLGSWTAGGYARAPPPASTSTRTIRPFRPTFRSPSNAPQHHFLGGMGDCGPMKRGAILPPQPVAGVAPRYHPRSISDFS